MLFIGVTDELLWRSLIALQQNIASYKNYGKSNGIAEISGQLPTIIGPAISIPVLLYLGAYFSLLVGSLMCIIPLYFISRINENFIPESFKPRDKKGTFNMAKKYPYEIIFIFLLNFPYIMISVGNFLKPVFIVTVIHGNASSIAISEMVYAVFASFTGMILTFTLKKHEILLAYSFFSMYIIGSLLMPFSGIFMIYLICQGIHGIGNPGTRISRNTFVMKHVENKYSGRFNSALSLFTNASRLLLLIIFTTFINILGSKELLFLSAIMLIIIISLSILITRKPEVKNFINGKSIIKL